MKKKIPKQRTGAKKIWMIILALGIASIMIGSALNMRSGQETDKYKYKNYLFTKTDQGWISYINNKGILLSYDPLAIENISTDKIALADLNSAQKIYFSTNPEENLYKALYDFQINIIPLLKPVIVPSCTVDIEVCKDSPLKTCEDATQFTKVIIFKQENQTKINYKNNCLVVQGKSENLTKATDKLILTLLGI